jgi:hypothetical protein
MNGSSAASSRSSAEALRDELSHFRADHTEQRFTIDGSPQLEQRLNALCEEVLAGVLKILPASLLEALVLGGGYGRGQGGVLATPAGDEPYNDLEFYVFLKGNRLWNERRYNGALQDLGERLSSTAGLHVEFKIDSLARYRRASITMFSYDLVAGHRILFAPGGDFPGCAHHLDPRRIPLVEGTRLLMNRCTGLLLARERLLRSDLSAEDADFIGRNIAKARLALGDAVLVESRQYHWSCVERHERLARLNDFERMPWLSEVKRHHADGREFKLHPRRTNKPARALANEHAEISALARQVWLWLESRRLGSHFASARDYALTGIHKHAGGFGPRNFALNLRTFGLLALRDGGVLRYPRERLLNALPLLLWEEPLNDLRIKRYLQKLLQCPAADWHSLVAAYKSVWPQFS